ncbi:hypothetical protein NFI96_011114 [Prochilodus magdalenae]|nr:hypothetical protein NFI96_011114 [Prochilodus magdalenae]
MQTTMSTAVAALLLLFLAVFGGKTKAYSDDLVDCCLSTSPTLIPRHIAASYTEQGPGTGCSVPATVFTTKKNKKLCSPPASDKEHPWVAKLMAYLDKQDKKKQQTHLLNWAEIHNILSRSPAAMASTGVSCLCVALWLTGLFLSSNLTVSLGDQAVDCCLSVSNHPIPKNILTSYREQVKGEGCTIDAVIFNTIKGKKLCAPPDSKWVKHRKNYLDVKQCNENKGKNCQAPKAKSA